MFMTEKNIHHKAALEQEEKVPKNFFKWYGTGT
jgi:hypothetical protein